MRFLYSLLLIFCVVNYVIAQSSFERGCSDDTPRLGPLAEPQRFSYVSDKDGRGYYEVISGQVAAYIICGKKIEIPIGDVVDLNADLYQGSYEGHSGVWGETLVDFDGSGPEWSTRVFILLNDLKKLPGKPDDPKRLFSYRVSAELGKQSEFRKREDSYYLPFLVVGLVIITFLVVRNLAAEVNKETCPACKRTFIRGDIMTNEVKTGYDSYSTTETRYGTVYDSSGHATGESVSYQVPSTGYRANYKRSYTCKSCGHKWTTG